MGAAREAQTHLARIGEQMAEHVIELDPNYPPEKYHFRKRPSLAAHPIKGLTFVNPGVKLDRDRIRDKANKRGGIEKVTDLTRGSFLVDHPNTAGRITKELGKHFAVADEDWFQRPEGYGDKALQLRFPSGMIGEMQILHPAMYKAKMGEGHRLYNQTKAPGISPQRKKHLTEQMINVYRQAVSRYSPAWRKAFGITMPGRLALKAASETGLASCHTSTQSISSHFGG